MRFAIRSFAILSTLMFGLLFSAASAGAFALNMVVSPLSSDPSTILGPSDDVIVDIYLDAEPGLGLLGVAVTFDDDGILVYDSSASMLASYILYAPASGAVSAAYLIPNVDPPAIWNGTNLPGKQQLLVEYLEPTFGSTTASGTGIWIGTLTFGVASVGDGESTIDLLLTAPGTVLQAYGVDVKAAATATGSVLIDTIADPLLPACEVATSQPSYAIGEDIVITKLRYTNPTAAELDTHLIFEITIPGFPTFGAIDGVFALPAGLDNDLGPITMFTNQGQFPSGSWELRCATEDPSSTAVWSEVQVFFDLP